MASAGTPVQIEEEDDELFEIDLQAVDSIFPPPHLSDDDDTYCFLTAAGGAALLANCLLPISDVSGAVPMDDSGRCEVFTVATPPGFSLRQALIDRLGMEITTG